MGVKGSWQALGPYLNVFVGLGFFLLPSVSCFFKAGTIDYGDLLCGDSPLSAHSCFPKYIGMIDGDVYKICLPFQFLGRYI